MLQLTILLISAVAVSGQQSISTIQSDKTVLQAITSPISKPIPPTCVMDGHDMNSNRFSMTVPESIPPRKERRFKKNGRLHGKDADPLSMYLTHTGAGTIMPDNSVTEVRIELTSGTQTLFGESTGGAAINGVGIAGDKPGVITFCGLSVANDRKSAIFYIKYTTGIFNANGDYIGFNIIVRDDKFPSTPIFSIIDPKVHDSGVNP